MTAAIPCYELDPACQQTMMEWATTFSVDPTDLQEVPALNLAPVDILNIISHYAEMRPSERLASAVAAVEGENHTPNCSALVRNIKIIALNPTFQANPQSFLWSIVDLDQLLPAFSQEAQAGWGRNIVGRVNNIYKDWC